MSPPEPIEVELAALTSHVGLMVGAIIDQGFATIWRGRGKYRAPMRHYEVDGPVTIHAIANCDAWGKVTGLNRLCVVTYGVQPVRRPDAPNILRMRASGPRYIYTNEGGTGSSGKYGTLLTRRPRRKTDGPTEPKWVIDLTPRYIGLGLNPYQLEQTFPPVPLAIIREWLLAEFTFKPLRDDRPRYDLKEHQVYLP